MQVNGVVCMLSFGTGKEGRGAPGYLALEWRMECAITENSDVYSFSFRMMVLEIMRRCKNYSKRAESYKCYLPALALSRAVVGRETEVIDSRLAGDYDFDRKQAIRVLKIGFLCIQEDAHCRPSMRTVVQMLEGQKEVPDLPLYENFQFSIEKRMNSRVQFSVPWQQIMYFHPSNIYAQNSLR